MQDEIDLLELFLKFFKFVKRKFKIILFGTIAGAIIGISIFYIEPARFLYTINGYSPYIADYVITNSISEFSSALKADKYEFCKSENLDLNTFENVKSVEVKEEENTEKGFEISVITDANINIDTVSIAIEKYISKNSYVNKKMDVRKEQLKNTIDFFDEEIQKLGKRETLRLNRLEIVKQDETAASLYIDKNKYEEQLAFLKPLIITNKSIPQKKNYGLIVHLAIGSVLAVFLIFAFFLLHKVNNITKQSQVTKPAEEYFRVTA